MQESGIMRSKNKHDYIFEVLFSINMHAAFLKNSVIMIFVFYLKVILG